jgi:predicted metal-dependent phosphoesterase TrpH
MIIDLHTHSYYSADGKLSISELLDFYSAGDIVALTDHETIAGWEDFRGEALGKGITPILGIEWFLRDYCHILCYFVHAIPQVFYDFIVERRSKERHCMNLLYEKAKEQFTNIPSYDDILASKPHPENILGLAALACHVVKESKLDFKEVVELLRNKRREIPDCEKPLTFSPRDLLQLIKSWNGISVLAHPFKNSHRKEGRQCRDDVQKKVRELAAMGIRGVELYSDGSNLDELEYLFSLASELKLLVSIGSDYHDKEKGARPTKLASLEKRVSMEVKKWLNL